MAIVGSSTRTWHSSNTEYRPYLTGSTWGTQSRIVTTYSGKCVVDSDTFPTPITGGTRMVTQSTTPRENGWYDYEETSVTEGVWA